MNESVDAKTSERRGSSKPPKIRVIKRALFTPAKFSFNSLEVLCN